MSKLRKNELEARETLNELDKQKTFEVIFKSSAEEIFKKYDFEKYNEAIFSKDDIEWEKKYYGISDIQSDRFIKHLRVNYGIDAKKYMENINTTSTLAIPKNKTDEILEKTIEKKPKKLLSGLIKRFNIKALHKKYHKNIDDFKDSISDTKNSTN